MGEIRNLCKILVKNLKERDVKDLQYRMETTLKWILQKKGGRVWWRLIWARIESSVGPWWTQYWSFEFHKRLGMSWVAVQMLAYQEGVFMFSFLNSHIKHACIYSNLFNSIHINEWYLLFTLLQAVVILETQLILFIYLSSGMTWALPYMSTISKIILLHARFT
jgi:hypothetical protein